MARTVWTVVKVAIAAAILAYLIFTGRDAFAQLSRHTIRWPMLGVALLFTFAMATLSFLRWHLLIRALGIDMRLVDTLRLGALGFALNFVSPGSIGGDFFKAIFLAHGHPKQRTESVATILADRVIGLLTMLTVASIGVWATGILASQSSMLRIMARSILIFTLAAWLGCIVLLFAGKWTGNWVRTHIAKVPIVGATFARLLDAVEVYRGQIPMLAVAVGVSLGVGLCYTTSYYYMARGLPMNPPTWTEHLVIVPVAGLAGSLPVTPSGLGTTEIVIENLYKAMPGGTARMRGDGTLVSLGRRLTDIAVALVGLVFYISNRREVQEVYAEAEEYAETGEAPETA
ncbi:MAG TPA: lysylphosphatidylglycerol synthase transmembrane domain-containing protein [Lacipirellulaceae bacterium]|nr:lysylphosphatidylglycerol synthase transmembrane domain-containing protein [Lacipirellulaceae bacterium]